MTHTDGHEYEDSTPQRGLSLSLSLHCHGMVLHPHPHFFHLPYPPPGGITSTWPRGSSQSICRGRWWHFSCLHQMEFPLLPSGRFPHELRLLFSLWQLFCGVPISPPTSKTAPRQHKASPTTNSLHTLCTTCLQSPQGHVDSDP